MGGILFLNSNQSKSLPLVQLGNFPQKRFPPLLRPQPAMAGDNLGVGLNTRPPTTTNEEAMKTASRGRGEETTLARARTDRIGSKAGFVSVFPVPSTPARLPSTHYRVDHQLVEIQTAVRIGQVGDNASPHIGSIVTRTRRQDVN